MSQGALAVEIRSDDTEARKLCKALTHPETWLKCLAERALLRRLEGGCSVPVGVDTGLTDTERGADGLQSGLLQITGCVTAIDGLLHVQDTLSERVHNSDEAERLGVKLAVALIEQGAGKILEEINADRARRTNETSSK